MKTLEIRDDDTLESFLERALVYLKDIPQVKDKRINKSGRQKNFKDSGSIESTRKECLQNKEAA